VAVISFRMRMLFGDGMTGAEPVMTLEKGLFPDV
jgi:hypothetical protein